MKKKKKPATPFDWAIYRSKANRALAIDVMLDNEEKDITYKNFRVARYLLDIVGDLREAITILEKKK